MLKVLGVLKLLKVLGVLRTDAALVNVFTKSPEVYASTGRTARWRATIPPVRLR